jgi:hypothetical protein
MSKNLVLLLLYFLGKIITSEKTDPHIGVLAGFYGSGWDKICGKIQVDLKGLCWLIVEV